MHITQSTMRQLGEILYGVNFWVLGGLAMLSIFPFDLRKGRKSFSLYVPFIAVLIVILYEIGIRMAIPSEAVPIRVDLMIIMPLMAFILFMGLLRWIIVFWYRRSPNLERPLPTGRKQQIFVCFVIGSAAVLWFCLNWF